MSRTFSIILGILTIIGVWYYFFVLSQADNEIESIIAFCVITLGMGLAYSFLYQKNYPVQTISIVLIVEFILYKIFGQGTQRMIFGVFLFQINLFLGTLSVIFGPVISKVATSILSPVQRLFKGIGLNFSIPVITGIVVFIGSFFWLSSGVLSPTDYIIERLRSLRN